MQEISLKEINFHPSSQADSNGRVFEWNGRLYRGIVEEHASFFRKLFADGVIDRLVNKELLVPTTLETLTVPGFPLVLGHKRVPFVSYPYEWTPRMLQDASLLILDVNLELAEHGLTAPDGHPWNVLFDCAKAVFVDVGSIVSRGAHDSWGPDEEFQRFCLRPLRLFERREHRLARWLLRDHEGVSEADLLHIGLPTMRRATGYFKRRAMRVAKRELQKRKLLSTKRPSVTVGSMKTELRDLRLQVENISLPLDTTEWGDYYERASFPSLTDRSQWTPKHLSAVETLEQLHPTTVLDIAGNRGWFSQMAAKLGSNVVTYDNDESAVELLYHDAKRDSLSVLPVIGNLLSPTPERTWLGRGWPTLATERFRCDLVLALAIVHHMVFRFSIKMRFEQIADILCAFSRRWVVVEFIPPGDAHVAPWITKDDAWYTLENFVAALSRHVRVIRQLPSHPQPRVLLVCERIQPQ